MFEITRGSVLVHLAESYEVTQRHYSLKANIVPGITVSEILERLFGLILKIRGCQADIGDNTINEKYNQTYRQSE